MMSLAFGANVSGKLESGFRTTFTPRKVVPLVQCPIIDNGWIGPIGAD
jgi:hypothetical protein